MQRQPTSRKMSPLLKLNVRTQPSLKPVTSRLSDPSKRIAVTATGSSLPSRWTRMRATNCMSRSPVSAFHTQMIEASSALTASHAVLTINWLIFLTNQNILRNDKLSYLLPTIFPHTVCYLQSYSKMTYTSLLEKRKLDTIYKLLSAILRYAQESVH